MDSLSVASAVWWLGLVLLVFASKADRKGEVERLQARLVEAEARAARVNELDRRLKQFERVISLAHLMLREAREARNGLRSEPSELERLLIENLGKLVRARQQAEALKESEHGTGRQ